MPARLPEDQRSQADGLWADTDHLHDGKLVALVQVWCPQPVLCTQQCTHTHISPREKRWAYFNLPWDATWVSLSSISRVYHTLMILSTITVSIAFCLFLTVNGPTCGCHCCLHSIWTYMEYSTYGDIYGVQKILCKWVGCKYGQHIFLLLPSYFLYLNLHVYWVILFDLIDVLMKPSITSCIFTSTFVLSLSGTFHLLFVVRTLASSYSFVTLMKSLLLD